MKKNRLVVNFTLSRLRFLYSYSNSNTAHLSIEAGQQQELLATSIHLLFSFVFLQGKTFLSQLAFNEAWSESVY